MYLYIVCVQCTVVVSSSSSFPHATTLNMLAVPSEMYVLFLNDDSPLLFSTYLFLDNILPCVIRICMSIPTSYKIHIDTHNSFYSIIPNILRPQSLAVRIFILTLFWLHKQGSLIRGLWLCLFRYFLGLNHVSLFTW